MVINKDNDMRKIYIRQVTSESESLTVRTLFNAFREHHN